MVVILYCSFQTGAEVVNATDLVKEPLKFPHWERPDDPQFLPPKTIKDDPDYHEDPIYEFHPRCRLLEGTTCFVDFLQELCQFLNKHRHSFQKMFV